MKIFERDTKVTVNERDGLMEITGYLNDVSHEMMVRILVETETMLIKEAGAEMIRVPYTVCNRAIEEINLMAGLKIKSGINRQLHQLFGGTKGCVHIIEVLQDCFKGAVQAKIRIETKGLDIKDRINRYEEMLAGTCLRYVKKTET